MINFRFISNLMGRLLIVESAFLLICVIVALVYQETDIMAFFYTTLITGIAGFLMINFIKIKDRTLAKKTVISWSPWYGLSSPCSAVCHT